MKYNKVYFFDENKSIGLCSFGALEKVRGIGLKSVYYFPPWNIWALNFFKWVLRFRNFLRTSQSKLVVCTNEFSEMLFLKSCGIPSILANQNMNANEYEFYVQDASRSYTEYDAVYSAMLAPFKRLFLAENIKKLYILTYKLGSTSADLHNELPQLKHANFNREFLEHSKVRSLYNSSRCGLALSRREGAMWASIEYQLCGLPVVSTPAKGGRFHYYNSETWIVCRANRESVSAAVQKIIRRDLDPNHVRQVALLKILKERRRFYSIVKHHVRRFEGVQLLPFETIYGVSGLDGNSRSLDSL